jgi:hypothetical protein
MKIANEKWNSGQKQKLKKKSKVPNFKILQK